MKELKEMNMVELAEYAVENKIKDKLAFAWWSKEALKGIAG
jgi:hypothetical protein